MQTPPAGNLKERIAALQQRSVSAPPQPSPQSTPVSKPSSPANSPAGSLRSKIAKFESKGGIPIPRSSFGLGAPAEGAQSASREMYGNRIPGVNRPSGSVSRSGSPLPGVDEPSGAAEGRKRRVSTGAFDGSLDLAGVTQKLTYQRTLDKLNGTTPTDSHASPGIDRSNSSEVSGKDSLPTSPRRKSMQVIGAGRRSVSSMDVFSKYGTQPEFIVRALSSSPLRKVHSITDEQDTKREAPSIVISPEPSSASPGITEGSRFVDEPAELGSDNPVISSRSKPAETSPPKVASPTAGNATLDRVRSSTIECSPVTSPVSPTPTNGAVQTMGRPGLEHPPDSPYLEFAKPSSPPASPLKVQPVIRKVTSPVSPLKSKTDGTIVLRPTRSSSLAPATRTSRSPSPTPSMIHRPESAGAGDTRAVKTILKARTTSSDKLARRPIVALVANRPPAPENEADVSYGSVTLASRSETNLINPGHKKIGFSAVVHRKVTENTQSSPSSDARSVRSVPNMTSHVRRAVEPSLSMTSTSPGYGDLAALLAEAALLEERLKRGESVSDIAQVDSMHSDASSQPTPSIERSSSPDTYDDEVKDQVPPPPPPKGFPRMLSNLKKLTGSGSLRSAHGSHSRISTSGSEMSSEDSASVGTPSDNGIPFPGSQSNGSLDRPGSSGSSALGVGHPPNSPKKNSGSRASSFADKIWHRSRTKSNNSNTERGESSIPRKYVPLQIPAAHSKHPRSNAQPPALPPILSTNDTDLAAHRPISWQSTTSTNTNSTVSPGGRLFDDALFDAFPSVPQEVPQGPYPPSPGFGTTNFPRTSMHEVGRSATLPPRTRKHSAQKLG